jgi:hypothetical protein
MWSPGRKSIIILIAIGLGITLSFYYVPVRVKFKFTESFDFYKFYMSAKYFWEDTDIYKLVPMGPLSHMEGSNQGVTGESTDVKMLHPNLNSPFFTLCLAPLGLMAFGTAFWIWTIASICCALASVIILSNNLSRKRGDLVIVSGLCLVMFAYYPSYVNILLGQVAFFLLLLIVIAWVASREGNDLVAGVTLGLAMALKIFLGIFLLVFLVRRRWRLVLWLSGVFLLCNLASFAALGSATYKKFLFLLNNMPWYAGSWNASFTGFLTRIFGGSGNNPLVPLPWVAPALSAVLSSGYLLWLIWMAWPRSQEGSKDRFDLIFSLAIVGMLLISPYGWVYYFPLLIIPAAVAWKVSPRITRGFSYKVWIIFSWCLSSIPTGIIAAEDIPVNQPKIWFFTYAAYYFYSLLMFSGILISLIYRLRGNPREDLGVHPRGHSS